MVTMKDVAERAGVALSTVSHVYSGKRPISKAVKKRVLSTAAEMGYRHNVVAKSLATNKTNVIGLYISSLSVQDGPFFTKLLRGLSSVANQEGYRFLLNIRESSLDREQYYRNIHKGDAIDGVIITDPRINDCQIAKILNTGIPFVVIGRPTEEEGIPYVDTDNQGVGYCATSHLIRLGHKDIAFINGPPDYTVTRDRLAGYQRALAEAGMPYREDLVVFASDFSMQCGAGAVADLLERGVGFTGLFLADDNLSLGAVQYLKTKSIEIPSDVAVVGVNNTTMSEVIDPPLTIIDIFAEELGAAAARTIIDLLEERDVSLQRTLGYKIVVRKSCGALR